MGERTIVLDCDVLQADGGTRTAAITASWVAMMMAMDKLIKEKRMRKIPVRAQTAAISVGKVDGLLLLDLCYEEDSNAEVDMNVIMSDKMELIEIQASSEKNTFDRSQLNEMLDLAEGGLKQIFALQREALLEAGVVWTNIPRSQREII